MWRYMVALSLGMLSARHIAGADFYYQCVDPVQHLYLFELWLYRDCTDPAGADYDDPITIYVFRGNQTLYTTLNVRLSQSAPWNPQGIDACFLQRPGTCLEEGTYRFTLSLPPIPEGYYVAWARCCRNATITNLQDPLFMGITYLTRIPPARRVSCNSSPRFVQRPPFFLCANRDFYFDHRAIDTDGDSLVYQIVAAYHSINTQGQGALNPAQGGSPAVGPSNPMGPPPYQTVTYAPGYSATQPFGSTGICQIDSATGLLHLRAPNPGLYVVAIAVLEYRNGAFLGETRRDMQFYVAPCRPPSPPPVVTTDLTGLPHRGDTLTLLAASAFCFHATITDTAPPLTPPASLSYLLSPATLSVQASGSNPLSLRICGQLSCQDTGKILPLYIIGRKTETCGTTEARDTLWIEVQAPPPRSLSGQLTPPSLPQQNGIYLIDLDSTACATITLVATPPYPPPQMGLSLSTPSPTVQLSTFWQNDTLFGQVCYRGSCEAIETPLTIALRGIAENACPPHLTWQDTLRFQVLLPQNPPPTLTLLAPDTLILRPDSGICLRVQITDPPPTSHHTLYVQAIPPLLNAVSLSPSQGSLSWEGELCFTPSCEALERWITLIVEIRDSLSCAELHRRRDTLFLYIRSRPTYPVALYTPSWDLNSPFPALFQKEYCFWVSLKDTAGNGGSYSLTYNQSPIPITAYQVGYTADSAYAQLCFRLGCEGFQADSLYPLIIRAHNTPFCAMPPPDVEDTLWIR
ncbi:MAG: hypothetical protein N2170_08105, partial [Bacteroidia bacterium]|nr:hypothetical protein [Bacteroidia bacterium]